MEILQIENLSFRYPGAERCAVDGVSFSVHSGEFLVVCGASGCGKTTLLRLLKPELAPAGELSGRIVYSEGERTPAQIGYVLQNPDNQIVTDKVWHELAFGLENMGLPTGVIRRRVGEMANYFGIQDWFRKKTDELSGGQKQLLNLAAVMVMQPRVLILD
ncbi:MAG: ABC transporter ATP-binding protein, partial [Eubacteriales bacterium]|nr:ABC transporter ATP-binding protein [Eubacteriales bacterium]